MARHASDTISKKRGAHLYIALSRTPRTQGNYHWAIVVAPSTPHAEPTNDGSTGVSLYQIREPQHSSYPWPSSPSNSPTNSQKETQQSPSQRQQQNQPTNNRCGSKDSGNSAPSYPHPMHLPRTVSYSHSHQPSYTHFHHPIHLHSHFSYSHIPSHTHTHSHSQSQPHTHRTRAEPMLAHEHNVSLTSNDSFFGCISVTKSLHASPEAMDLFLRLYEAADDSPSRFPEHDRWNCSGWVLRALSDLNEAGIISIHSDMDKVRQRIIALAMILESRRRESRGESEKENIGFGLETPTTQQAMVGWEMGKSIPIMPLDL